MRLLGFSVLVCASVVLTPRVLFAQPPTPYYMALGGILGGVEDCTSCKAIGGFELGFGLQTSYVRGELFYLFGNFEAEGVVVRGERRISFESDVKRHAIGVMGAVRFPIIAVPPLGPQETGLRFVGTFVGGGMGGVWEEGESYIKESQQTVTTDPSSFLLIATVGSEIELAIWQGHALFLEVGYRYHYTTDEKVDGARSHHLVVVRTRYGF